VNQRRLSFEPLLTFVSKLAIDRDRNQFLKSNYLSPEQEWIQETMRKGGKTFKRLSQENELVAEIGRIISSTLNIDEVYECFGEEVGKLIPFDRISINLANLERNTSTVAYSAGITVPERRAGNTAQLTGTFTEEVMRTRKSQLIQNDEKEILSRFPGLLFSLKVGLRSNISVPLISKNEVIGILHIRSRKVNAYTEEDLKLAERVGNQIAGAIANAQLFNEIKRAKEEREKVVLQLQDALAKVKKLSGLIPICASCKKIRDDKGYWNQIETYLLHHSEAEFSHGICPECMKKLYPDLCNNEKDDH